LSAVTGIVEGKLPKNLKKFLESEISDKEMKKESLVICDPKLGKLKNMVTFYDSLESDILMQDFGL
jgi:nucleolar protein 58